MLNSNEHEISAAHKTKMLKSKDFSWFQTLRCCINHANKMLKCQQLLAF